MLAVTVAMAAQFLSGHYGVPVMLMAILLGMPLHFLAEDDRAGPGIDFAARTLLRAGVALLGLRVSLDMVAAIGWPFVALVAGSVAAVILGSVALARRLGQDRAFGLLTGGVGGDLRGIGGDGHRIRPARAGQRGTRPVLYRDHRHGHVDLRDDRLSDAGRRAWAWTSTRPACSWVPRSMDVAQVVGAGYSVSEETGDIATVVKLIRVTLLAPVVLIAALVCAVPRPRGPRARRCCRASCWCFLVLAAANSAHLVPLPVTDAASTLSRACWSPPWPRSA